MSTCPFHGAPTALDLAVTACQRLETLAESGRVAGAAAAAYAHSKAVYQDTARVCAAQGVKFQPMVVEGTGTWDAEAAKVLWHIARATAAREGTRTCCRKCA